MFYNTLAAAALTLALTTGGAFSQAVQDGETPTVSGEVQGMMFAFDSERAMFESRMAVMSGFFTDETMTTMRSDEEMAAAFSALSAGDQASLRSDCERALQDRGSFGSVTLGLCTAVGAL